MLAVLYGTLRSSSPELSLSVRIVENPIACLLGDTDLAFCFGVEVPEGPWSAREVLQLPERLIASPGYLEEHGVPECLEDLHTHELLFWEPQSGAEPRLPLKAGGHFSARPALVSNDIHTMRQCASLGLGILYGPDGQLATEQGPMQEMVPVLDDLVGGQRSMSVVTPSAATHPPRVQSAIDGVYALFRVEGEA
jgi:DNA-binding transcriptional LysR family regulator